MGSMPAAHGTDPGRSRREPGAFGWRNQTSETWFKPGPAGFRAQGGPHRRRPRAFMGTGDGLRLRHAPGLLGGHILLLPARRRARPRGGCLRGRRWGRAMGKASKTWSMDSPVCGFRSGGCPRPFRRGPGCLTPQDPAAPAVRARVAVSRNGQGRCSNTPPHPVVKPPGLFLRCCAGAMSGRLHRLCRFSRRLSRCRYRNPRMPVPGKWKSTSRTGKKLSAQMSSQSPERHTALSRGPLSPPVHEA